MKRKCADENPVIRGSGHRRGMQVLPPYAYERVTYALYYLPNTEITRDRYWLSSDVHGWPPAGRLLHYTNTNYHCTSYYSNANNQS